MSQDKDPVAMALQTAVDALTQITRDCTARKSVMIARKALAEIGYESLEREHFGDPDKRTGIYVVKDQQAQPVDKAEAKLAAPVDQQAHGSMPEVINPYKWIRELQRENFNLQKQLDASPQAPASKDVVGFADEELLARFIKDDELTHLTFRKFPESSSDIPLTRCTTETAPSKSMVKRLTVQKGETAQEQGRDDVIEEMRFEIGGLLITLDDYPENPVPINKNSAMIRGLRKLAFPLANENEVLSESKEQSNGK